MFGFQPTLQTSEGAELTRPWLHQKWALQSPPRPGQCHCHLEDLACTGPFGMWLGGLVVKQKIQVSNFFSNFISCLGFRSTHAAMYNTCLRTNLTAGLPIHLRLQQCSIIRKNSQVKLMRFILQCFMDIDLLQTMHCSMVTFFVINDCLSLSWVFSSLLFSLLVAATGPALERGFLEFP